MIKTISILGCGWLGFPLAEKLIAEGFKVKGSVTTSSKLQRMQKAGIWPYKLTVGTDHIEMNDSSFFDADLIIVSIPPQRIPDIEQIYPKKIRTIGKMFEQHQVPRVLFFSSTSVYAEGGIVREEDVYLPDKPSGKALVLAEKVLLRNNNFRTTVLRFGGLIGAERNPARFLANKKEAIDGSKPVNLIHQDDCLSIVSELIRYDVWGEVFNACCPVHPTRKEFYMMASEVSGIPAPKFYEGNESYKIVDSSKLIRELNFQFKYKSPIDYLKG